MADFSPGDVVVLKSGSMRMLVERVDEDGVAVLWANEGAIGREVLPAFALNKWEERKWEDRPPRDDRPARPWAPRPPRDDAGAEGGGEDRPRGPRAFGGPKPGGKPPFKKPFGAKPFGGGAGGGKPYGDRPPRTGMDGKPRQKTFYRKDE